jgi:hypothetical protein
MLEKPSMKATYEFLIGLGLNRMDYYVLSLQLRCIFVSEWQRRFVDVEANLGKNALPGDQKSSGKFRTNLLNSSATYFTPGGLVFQTHYRIGRGLRTTGV